MSDEELLKEAGASLNDALYGNTDHDIMSANSLQSIAASLLVIARNMVKESK